MTGAAVVLVLAGPLLAQVDPCAENGPDCRLLTAAEVGAIKARLLAHQALMPVPDPARFAPPPNLSKAMTLDFVAELLPHSFLASIDEKGDCIDVTESEATDIEKTPTFLTYLYGDGTSLRMIFGQRTCKEEETLRVGKPAAHLAPVMCITLQISAPNRAELLALRKKIDRKAIEALLGSVMK